MVTVDKMSTADLSMALNDTFPPGDNGWTKVGGGEEEIWDFAKNGAAIEGLLLEVRHDIGKHKSNLYIIQQPGTGNTYGVWGSTVIDGKFFNDDGSVKIAVGNEVRIEYAGMKETKDKASEYKNFEVYYRPAPMRKA
jgi:hypothetical protein